MTQTFDIDDYYVNYQRQDGNGINIRIIDVPEFCDLKGITQDNVIIYKLKDFFERQIEELDYILITMKANTTRLCPSSEYIYNRIQEIFGNDAKNRFILICTFGDDKKPLVIETMDSLLNYEEYFCFNNSVLYLAPEYANINTKYYWKLEMENVKRFFDWIIKKDLPPLSLKLTNKTSYKKNSLAICKGRSYSIPNQKYLAKVRFLETLFREYKKM